MDFPDIIIWSAYVLFQTSFAAGISDIIAACDIYECPVSATVAYDIPVLPAGFTDDHFQR